MQETPSFEKAEEIFFRAVELAPEQRGEFLSEACGADLQLKAEVESLLAHDGFDVSRFAEDAVSRAALRMDQSTAEEAQGQRIGPYRLVRELGAGGMGSVWLAVRDDAEYERKAAIKFLRQSLQSDYTLRRFRYERQILAGLQHPNIAALFDGGTTPSGRPYIVMEYVEGPPVTDWANSTNLPLLGRIQLFRKICAAVQHAHRSLIVHRDLKPSNILVDKDGEPKLLDFGIAKLLDPGAVPDADLTRTSMRMLTPDYASPEQVRGEPVTTATDVYALGLILYELLTGQRAQSMKTTSELELHRAICESAPQRPSTVAKKSGSPVVNARALAGDLDNIVFMALRKEPERRYAGAEQLSDDLGRYVEGRPVIARGDSYRYRAGKFLRRNWLLSAVAAIAILSTIAGVVATLRQADLAERRFSQVRKLANTFLFDFHDRIQNLPGSTETREFVVSTALTYLDGLAREAEGDLAIQRELADAYIRIGDVQGLPGSANLGRPKDAQASYSRALSIAEQIQKRDPGPETLLLLSRIRLSQGATEGAVGAARQGAVLKQQAVELARQAASGPGGGVKGARRQWIQSLTQLGLQQMDLGQQPESVKTLRRAVEVEAEESRPEEFDGALRLGRAHHSLGTVLKMAGQHVEALDEFGRAQQLASAAAGLGPHDARPQSLLMDIHKELGDTVSSPFSPIDVDTRRAVREYSEMLRYAEQLLARDPKNQAAAYSVFLALAALSEPQGALDPKKGLETIARAQQVYDQYAPLHSGNQFSERGLMNIHLIRSSLYHSARQYEKAETEATSAFEILKTLIARDPARFVLVRDRINLLTWRGKARMGQRHYNQAEADLAACRELTPKLPPETSRNRDIRECAECFEASGDLARARGGRLISQRHYRNALRHWQVMKARGQRSSHIDMRMARLEARIRDGGVER